MGSEERHPDPALSAELAQALPKLPRLGFYALLALLERMAPRATRLADARSPGEEPVRLRHDTSLAFSAGDVSCVEAVPTRGKSVAKLEVVSTFLGLTGGVTPLPAFFAEEMTGDDPEATRAAAFLDLFHHRFLSLLYRCVAKYRLAYESTSSADDAWSERALALAGLDRAADPAVRALPVDLLLRLTPLLVDGVRPARSLELAIEEALARALGGDGPKARVEQFVGAWVDLAEADRLSLGVRNHCLGRHAPLGGKSFVRSGVVRIHLNPLTARTHARLSAGGDLRQLVDAVVRLFTRDPIDYELVLNIGREQRPRLQLGRASSGRVGIDAWLGASPAPAAPATSVRLA